MVTGVESFGLFVQGIELPAEGLVHVDSLADDYYRFDRATHTLAGHRAGNSYRLGDLLRVAVARVDLERRELDFRLVAGGQGRTPPDRPRPENRSKARGSTRPNAASHAAAASDAAWNRRVGRAQRAPYALS